MANPYRVDPDGTIRLPTAQEDAPVLCRDCGYHGHRFFGTDLARCHDPEINGINYQNGKPVGAFADIRRRWDEKPGKCRGFFRRVTLLERTRLLWRRFLR